MIVPVIDAIFEVFHRHGDDTYLGEEVTLTEHMLQTAQAAEQDNASAALVAAAVLHDFGHLVHEGDVDSADHGIDTIHEEVGAEFLRANFPPQVTEPIRLHVASKRYLCAVEPEYLAELSDASRHSLTLQGGPFSRTEVLEFENGPFFESAVRLRRYDDIAKIPGLRTPPLEHYRPVLTRVMLTDGDPED